MENGKKSLPFVYILITVICSILLLGWPFVVFGSQNGISAVISGYSVLTQWGSVWYVFASLLQILSFVCIVLLLVITIWGWIASCGKAEELKVGNWGMKVIAELLFLINICLITLMFIFWVVAIKTGEFTGAITFGLMLYFLLNLASFGAYLILRAKGVIEKDGLFAKIEPKSIEEESAEINGPAKTEIKEQKANAKPVKAEPKVKEAKAEPVAENEKPKKDEAEKKKPEENLEAKQGSSEQKN